VCVASGYYVNLDPATKSMPFGVNIDIRDTINYHEVMKQYNLGPNGAIMTSLNLFSTKFDQVLEIIEKRASDAGNPLDYILIDTPGQIEAFTWSASGSIISEGLATSFPTVMAFIVDTPRATAPSTFMSNMLYACSMLYRSRLPLVVVFNKTDVTPCEFAIEWMQDWEKFQEALEENNNQDGYYGSLTRSMSLCLDEFYRGLKFAGVSAASGEGVGDFFKIIDEARGEFMELYFPDLLLRREEQVQKKMAKVRVGAKNLIGDMKNDPNGDQNPNPNPTTQNNNKNNINNNNGKKLPETYNSTFHGDGLIVSRMPYTRVESPPGVVKNLSVVSFGASSFSNFFNPDNDTDNTAEEREAGWVDTVVCAIRGGINLIDTAPWYGHGESEKVLGKAFAKIPRNAFYLQTKVGRYEADPAKGKMFDFSFQKTIDSVNNSISVMKCGYLDVAQIHDPEFSPNLDIIVNETLPALDELRKEGKIRAIGMTGYPLEVQRELIERSSVRIDQSLTYAHNSLHCGGELFKSFQPFLAERKMALLSAAPLSMRLLTTLGPPEWHPAHEGLKTASKKAVEYCVENGVDIVKLATIYSCSFAHPDGIATTIIGCKNVEECESALENGRLLLDYVNGNGNGNGKGGGGGEVDIGRLPLSDKEKEVLGHILNVIFGPESGVKGIWEHKNVV